MVSCLLANSGSSISKRHSSCSCCPRCWPRRGAPCSTAFPPTICGSIRPALGKIPPHGTDAGSYLVAEVFGARRIILVKDVDGLYSADPKTNPEAKFIPDIRVSELMTMRLETLPVEPVVLELLLRSKLLKSIRMINGLERGNLTRALAGENVGTVIRA